MPRHAGGPGGPIDPASKVLASLKVLATGSFQGVVADTMNFSQSSVSRIFTPFLDAVLEVMEPQYMRWYTPREQQEAIEEFCSSSNIDGVLGIVDATHIGIAAPRKISGHPQAYVSGRKSYHTINTQVRVSKMHDPYAML